MFRTPAAPRRRRVTVLATITALVAGGFAAVAPIHPDASEALGDLGSLVVGAAAQGVGVHPDGSMAMVANTDAGTVSVIEIGDGIDGQFTVVDTVTVGGSPTDVTFSPDGTEAWVPTWSGNSVEIIDTETLTVIDTVSAGVGSFSVVFSHDGATAWVLNYGAGTIGVVDTSTRSLESTITGTGPVQRGILSADGSVLSVVGVNASYHRITTADSVRTSFAMGTFPLALAATADEAEHWVVDNANPSIYVLNSETSVQITTIAVPDVSTDITLAPDGRHMIVAAVDGTHLYDIATRSLVTTYPIAGSNGKLATVPDSNRVLRSVSTSPNGSVSVLGFDTERLAGTDRARTAIEISKRAFPQGADTVFIANGLDFPDALSAGPAAGLMSGSLLLTPPDELPPTVITEIQRLDPDTIYVVGGTGVIPPAVFNAIKALQPNTIRLSGTDRYATSRAIVDAIWDVDDPEFESPDRVYIATGRGFPDALSAGAAAAAFGDPVILVDGLASSIPSSTRALIAGLAPAQIYIAGGTGVVSTGIRNQLVGIYGADAVDRLAGANRYATSAAINAEIFPLHDGILYATGEAFPDALAGVALAGRIQAPLYLVEKSCVPAAAYSAIYTGQSYRLFLLGGTGALSNRVANLVRC